MAASRINPNRPLIRLSPVHSRDNSRSTSPQRRTPLYQKLDPLLSNLSPESTLHALTSTDAVPSNEKGAHDILSESISQVSPAERALGIRAAVAAQNLNLWHKEVQLWTWPSQQDAKLGKGFMPPQTSSQSSDPSSVAPQNNLDDNYYGSLPASLVERYEKRIEEIRDGMDDLNVEELKEHVLNAHIPSRSRPSSAASSISAPPPLSYVQLSDFTAVITATILRALPFLSRLNALLTTWDVRLLVLRQIPGLLRELTMTRSALDYSLDSMRSPQSSSSPRRYSDASLVTDHVRLESAVVAAGRRIDRVLDALEGRPDSLPENWIDDLERLESDFAAWVVETENYKVHNQWLRAQQDAKAQAAAQAESEKQLEETRRVPVSNEDLSEPVPTGESKPLGIKQESECAVESLSHETPLVILPSVNRTALAMDQPSPPASILEQFSDPKVSISPPVCATAEKQEVHMAVTEDLTTPTQAEFPSSILSLNGQLSAGQTPRANGSVSEDKENIPPSIPQTDGSWSTHRDAPIANRLTDHKDVFEDPFSRPSTAEAKPQLPTGTASTDIPPTEDANVSVGSVLRAEIAPALPLLQSDPENSPKSHLVDRSVKQTSQTPEEIQHERHMSTSVFSPDLPSGTSHIRMPRVRSSVKDSSQKTVAVESASHPNSAGFKSQIPNPVKKPDTPRTVRKPLQSPIKLSKTRSGRLSLDKEPQLSPKITRRRRTSTGSVRSLLSDHSSLISSPDVPGLRTASSNETPISAPSHPEAPHTLSHGDHTLREDRLRRLENLKPDLRVTFQQNRTVSLPLERFINERMGMGLGSESTDAPSRQPIKGSNASVGLPTLSKSRNKITEQVSVVSSQGPRLPTRRPQLSRGKSASDLHAQNEKLNTAELNRNAFARNSSGRIMDPQAQPKSLRLRQRLTAHPSLESLGIKRQELSYVEEHESELTEFGSRASSPTKQLRQPRDQMDERISSILNTLPGGRIQLVDSNHEADTSSSSSSVDRRMRYRSESPTGPPTRSTTPAPSLMLMPAARRRSHAFKTEDSCVKLYHLHHGGQSAPTKLFVRTVGETGQRVMVRVGGGWADLGEYLREYVIHHGRRKVSETPRVEVQGIRTRSSPSYSSPGAMLTPATSTYLTSGRATPSRPQSVLSTRPPSSLTVRKTRRSSNASDIAGTRAVTTGHLHAFTSPPPTVPHVPASGGRRLSVSSGYSIAESHSPANNSIPSIPHENRATPLGLAGPRPRARYASMSPEGEAWVEDVLQKTRRSSSHNPPPIGLGLMEHDDSRSEIGDAGIRYSLPKVRSIDEIGSIGTSRRVILRGLGSRRP
ncbi:uncharacterized protein N7511_006057 [Penicillium nucicola]|uniref:uncharacterized protein n=1 Tax=Penicillium nucicola TaxID=1850975 RepID=UPI002544F986|nr:uncharacterized protein N7511_006057 [Penicillium nucicola]KAJ5757363.1 hypothetical protein N7511_006057 [Penicillium nucicola]